MEKGRVTVFRYNPEKDRKPYYETHSFPFSLGMSVLDVATYIFEHLDPSFTFSYSCSNSHCGLCAARINGKPGLMCRESATADLTIEPLDNFPVIRDLMIERSGYEKNLDSLRLFLDRVSLPEKEPEKVSLEDQDLFKVASRCVECYSCLSHCPAYREGRHEFVGPAGLVQLARHAFDPRDQLNRPVVAYSSGVYNCTQCGNCTLVCPHDISPKENIALLRKKVVASGHVPRGVIQLLALVEKTGKSMMPPRRGPFLQEGKGPEKGHFGLFVGCNFDYDPNLQPAALGAYKALRHAGFEVAIPKEQICCGLPLDEGGEQKKVRDLVLRNVDLFEDAGCSLLVTICSGCGYACKTLWPAIYRDATGRDLPFEVKDFAELLAREDQPMEGLREVKRRISYHDPCLLNRGQGIHEEPRRLVKGIPGVEFVEMAEAESCCGGGGGLRMNNLALSQRILKEKVKFIQGAGVDTIVTCCPTCIKQLKAGLSQAGARQVRVVHPAALLSEAIG
jgi:fumarate reductase (CoM/CoB) subunit B